MEHLNDIIKKLNLKPHPEGGYYFETYRSGEVIDASALPQRYTGKRSFSTAIYYLLTPGSFSAMHRIKSDEIFHFYLGDPVEMLMLFPDGSGKTQMLGPDISGGMSVQVIVPGGTCQGLRLVESGSFALMGTTVSPGFEFEDFEVCKRDELIRLFPKYRELIFALTRNQAVS